MEERSYFARLPSTITSNTSHINYVDIAYEDDIQYHIKQRQKYNKEINKWLNYEFENTETDRWKITKRDTTTGVHNKKNKDICSTIFNQLVKSINKRGFEINDINLLKDEFIYFMYILSDISEPYE